MANSSGARLWYQGLHFVSSPRWLTVWDSAPGVGQPVAGPLPLSRPIGNTADLQAAADEWLAQR